MRLRSLINRGEANRPGAICAGDTPGPPTPSGEDLSRPASPRLTDLVLRIVLSTGPVLLGPTGCNHTEAVVAAPPDSKRSDPTDRTDPVVASTPDPVPKAIPAHLGRRLDRTFDDIKFDIEPDAPFDRSMLTDEILTLDGRPIRIRGYILPTAQKRGIKQFVLVRDNMECCFGPGAALYDCIFVEMLEGRTAEFSIRPVTVEGVFLLQEFPGPAGRPLAVYRLSGESVR